MVPQFIQLNCHTLNKIHFVHCIMKTIRMMMDLVLSSRLQITRWTLLKRGLYKVCII